MSGQEWGIVSAMLTVMTGEGVAIKILYNALMNCQGARVKGLENQLSMVKTASSELDPPGARGPQAPKGGTP